MALERKDGVKDQTQTTGTGTVTIDLAAPVGYRSMAAHTSGATVRYRIGLGSEWEIGEGIWTSGKNTLTRATVYASSNVGSLVDFSAGIKSVITTATAADFGGSGGTPGGSVGQFQYNNAGAFDGANLYVEDANTIAQRNGVTAQNQYIYNTRTDASNYERFSIGWASNTATISTEKSGTGASRSITISPLGSLTLTTPSGTSGITALGSRGNTFLSLDGGVNTAFTSGWSLGGKVGDYEAGGSSGRLTVVMSNAFRAPNMDIDKDNPALACTVKAGNATAKSGATNIVGAGLVIAGGDGSSAASGAAHGGPVSIAGGRAYGTGTDAALNLAYTGSAARGAVKCWGPLTLASSLALPLSAKTADYTVTANDGTLTADSTSAAITFTLEAASGHNRIHAFVKVAGGNTVTIDGNASETIDGSASITLTDRVVLQSNGTNWVRIA